MTTFPGDLMVIQNTVVDPRFKNDGYRDALDEQIYVGESIAPGNERIHFIGPKPSDTGKLMEDFLLVAKQLLADPLVPDLVASALIAYLFNFIHPFSDYDDGVHSSLSERCLMSEIHSRKLASGLTLVVEPLESVASVAMAARNPRGSSASSRSSCS